MENKQLCCQFLLLTIICTVPFGSMYLVSFKFLCVLYKMQYISVDI